MRVVRIAASCIGLLTTFGTLTSMAVDVYTPFIQQEAARADASLRQRAEAPMTGPLRCVQNQRMLILAVLL